MFKTPCLLLLYNVSVAFQNIRENLLRVNVFSCFIVVTSDKAWGDNNHMYVTHNTHCV